MNGLLIEWWGRWLSAVLQGQHQLDKFSGGWLGGVQNTALLTKPLALPWAMSMGAVYKNTLLDTLQQVWEPFFSFQRMSWQWMGMVPKAKYEALAEHTASLENKVEEQAHAIERLQELLSKTSGENNVVVARLQDLIGQQSQQFKQLTSSVSDYIKSSAKDMAEKK
jgi:protein gp37